MSDLNMQEDVSSAVTFAIRHIGTGIYSSGKIRDYLLKNGYSYETSSDAVEELILRKYIDDERAGRKVLLSRTGKKQESRSMLYRRLIDAGVSEAAASGLVSDLKDDITTCVALIDATYPDPSSLGDDPEDACAAVIKTCLRRGYTSEIASRAFRLWLSGADQ